MSAISRAYTFTDGSDAYGSQVENEFNTVYNAWNNHDAGTSIWTSLKAALLTMSGNIVMATNKITGLGNGTAAQDAAAFSQVKYIQAVQGNGTSQTSLTLGTFVATVVTASITPTSASNRIKITCSFVVAHSATGNASQFTIERGTTNLMDATGGAQLVGTSTDSQVSMVWIDSPATTSSTAYTVYGLNTPAAGTVTVGNGRTWTIVLEEIV